MKQNSKVLGNKIQQFRLKSGLSQMDVELEIDASPGSLSRIEAGKVNPTKETLTKISKALGLNTHEYADLIGLKILSNQPVLRAINAVSEKEKLEATLQTIVDVMYNLYNDYNGGIVFLIDPANTDQLCCKAVSSNIPRIQQVLNILTKPINELSVSLSRNQENYVVKSIVNKESFQSFNLYDFSKGAISESMSNTIQKIVQFNSGIVFPLSHKDRYIGAIFFTKRVRVPFNNDEIELLNLLSKQFAISIYKQNTNYE